MIMMMMMMVMMMDDDGGDDDDDEDDDMLMMMMMMMMMMMDDYEFCFSLTSTFEICMMRLQPLHFAVWREQKRGCDGAKLKNGFISKT